jgi:transglutaminase-like putative cysteine protease
MRIVIEHRTEYRYDAPVGHAVQSLRLTPPESRSQHVVDWSIVIPGYREGVRYTDAFGNIVDLVSPDGHESTLTITASGVVETVDLGGVTGFTAETTPPSVFLRGTAATRADGALLRLAAESTAPARLDTLHALMAAIHQRVAYRTGSTNSTTTASEAFAAGSGVCQDHAHIFIAAARTLGIPARYVTGYLLLDDDSDAVAHHAWAEAFTPELGWIGFDPANNVCPTERYVRLAIGIDAPGAAPIRGSRHGIGRESLLVEVVVRQTQQ